MLYVFSIMQLSSWTKKSFLYFLISIFALLLFMCISVGANDSDSFSGIRTVQLYTDISDMENFFNGGRSSVELALRRNTPEGINCSVSTDGRDVFITINFDFTSMTDYKNKVRKLTLSSPVVICDEELGIAIMEDYKVYDMFNFVNELLSEETFVAEKSLEDIFNVSKNDIVINSNSYETIDDRLSVKKDENIKFEKIDIDTTVDKSGSFDVKIEVWFNKEKYNVDDVENKFDQIGRATVDENNEGHITLEIEAESKYDYKTKLMSCFGVTFNSKESIVSIDEKTVGISTTEYVDTSELFDNNPVFSYDFHFPPYYQNVQIIENSGKMPDESTLSFDGNKEMKYYYERDLYFETTEINTDFSNIWGKKKRTIRFEMPLSLSGPHHEYIKKKISDKLIRGCVFNIYDNGGMKYYEITYSSFFDTDIEKFTKAILGGSAEFDTKESVIPFVGGIVTDIVCVNGVFGDISPSDRVICTYTLPILSSFSNKEIPDVSGRTVTFEAGVKTDINFRYKTFDIIKTALMLLLIIAVVIIAIIVIKKAKNKLKKAV